jgi:hypothetical protein
MASLAVSRQLFSGLSGGRRLIAARHRLTAARTHVLVAISFHFVAARIGFLAEVLRSLAAFPVARLVIVVFTNTQDIGEQGAVRAVFRELSLKEGRDGPHPVWMTPA